jgi:hypothetical protein
MSDPILKKLDRMRRYMEDPRRVVVNPYSIFEDMNGRVIADYEAPDKPPARASLSGWARFVGGPEDAAYLESLINAAAVALGYVSSGEALIRRRYLDVIDRATEMVTMGERDEVG